MTSPTQPPPPARRELFAWMMYDFANSGYTTVVLTAIFNVYFVNIIAGGADKSLQAEATLLWTVAIAIANGLVLLSAPVLGAIADHLAAKKRLLLASTLGCVIATALLSLAGAGDVALAMTLLIIATVMFSTGENLIAAFLPELATQENMGRLSARGWTVGYLGGLLVLGLCLAIIMGGEARGFSAQQTVPLTLLTVAIVFALAATPTFLWLRERAVPLPKSPGQTHNYLGIGFQRLRHTLVHARHYTDLFRFLLALTVYTCGINTVIVLAAIYAQQVMGFNTQDTILLILVVNITAAVGAFVFGHVQDRIGSVPTLAITLLVWIGATVLAYFTTSRAEFWVVANLVGLAMGASQSGGRALIGQFSPPARTAEFFGLWGLAVKLSAIIGPLSYGLITYLTDGDHRLAILSTVFFFIAGLALLTGINEQRGRNAALTDNTCS